MNGSEFYMTNAYETHTDKIKLVDYEGMAIAFIEVDGVPNLLCGCGATHPLTTDEADEAMPMTPIGTAARWTADNSDIESVLICGWICPNCKAAAEMLMAFVMAQTLSADGPR